MAPSQGKVAALQGFLLHAERELWGVLDGPWDAPGAGGVEHRRLWAHRVRQARGVRELALLAGELEAALRRTVCVMDAIWDACYKVGRAVGGGVRVWV